MHVCCAASYVLTMHSFLFAALPQKRKSQILPASPSSKSCFPCPPSSYQTPPRCPHPVTTNAPTATTGGGTGDDEKGDDDDNKMMMLIMPPACPPHIPPPSRRHRLDGYTVST